MKATKIEGEGEQTEMSDVARAVLNENELALRPEDIQVDEKFNIRRYADTNEDETKRVERLAKTIDRDGQIDAGVVVLNDKGGYTLTCGHRRRRAIILANQQRSASGMSLLRMRVTVDKSGGDALRKACISNIQRENLSAMEIATLIKRIREEHNWAGFPGAKKVAEYLGIEITTVTQHERFLTADRHTQDALHSGELTAQGAFTLLAVKPEAREEVFGKAREKQAEINARKKWADDNGAKKGEMKTTLSNGAEVPVLKKGEAATQPDKLTQPAIVAAIRETPDATQKDLPRTRKEIIEFFMSLDGPAYGYANGAVRQFVDYFCNSFCVGRGTETTLLKKFDAMTAGADQGTESKRDQEPADDAKTATGRLKRTDKGSEKPKSEKVAKAAKVVREPKAPKTPKPAKAAKAAKKPPAKQSANPHPVNSKKKTA